MGVIAELAELMVDKPIADALVVGFVSFLGGGAVYGGKRVARFQRSLGRMVADWHGHKADPARGIVYQPSVPEHLDQQDKRLEALEAYRAEDAGNLAALKDQTWRGDTVRTDLTGRVDGTTKDIVASLAEEMPKLAQAVDEALRLLRELGTTPPAPPGP